tara:strand:+ start:630 stop:731 length:102 start_codon:yes stop_codon:yes gene_type:complete
MATTGIFGALVIGKSKNSEKALTDSHPHGVITP